MILILCSQVYSNNSVSILLSRAEKLFKESLWLEDSERINLHNKSIRNLGNERSGAKNKSRDDGGNGHTSGKISPIGEDQDVNENKNENESRHDKKNWNENENKCGIFDECDLEGESGNICPRDCSLAAYYLASNMTIQDKDKQALLEAENIIVRLRCETMISLYV